ncbi:MAG: hypothetical protein ACHBNF_04815 [Chromatiales bacterium]
MRTSKRFIAIAKPKALRQDPIPSGLRFEKLQGYSNPEIFTFHVDGNYKVSLEVTRFSAA